MLARAHVYQVLACAVALLGGFVAARSLLAPSRQTASQPVELSHSSPAMTAGGHSGALSGAAAVVRAVRGPGPWSTVDGIPVGFARSERGAVAAAGSYLTVLAKTISPTASWSWTQAIRTLTVSPLRAKASRASRATQTVRQKLAVAGPTFVGSWLLGYRVISYAPARAKVAVWNVGLIAGERSVVAPYFSTATCTLIWADRDWKVAASETNAGPTPPSNAGQAQSRAFIATAAEFTPYRDVP